jgi:hypothetical protein
VIVGGRSAASTVNSTGSATNVGSDRAGGESLHSVDVDHRVAR